MQQRGSAADSKIPKPTPGGAAPSGSGSPLAAMPAALACYVQQADGSLRAVHAADALYPAADGDGDDEVVVYDAEDFLLQTARPARPPWRLSLGAARDRGVFGSADGALGGAGASAYAGTLPRLSWTPAGAGAGLGLGLGALRDTLYSAVAGRDRAGDEGLGSRAETLSREGSGPGLCGGWDNSAAAAEPDSRVTSQVPLTRGVAQGPDDAGPGLGFSWGAATTRRPRQLASSRARSAVMRWLRHR